MYEARRNVYEANPCGGICKEDRGRRHRANSTNKDMPAKPSRNERTTPGNDKPRYENKNRTEPLRPTIQHRQADNRCVNNAPRNGAQNADNGISHQRTGTSSRHTEFPLTILIERKHSKQTQWSAITSCATESTRQSSVLSMRTREAMLRVVPTE
jgi:hypothetical protein